MIAMTQERAQWILDNVLSKVNSRIPQDMVPILFDIYNKEIAPNRFREVPCSCNPSIWRDIIAQTRGRVDEVLAQKKRVKPKPNS